MKIQDEYKKYSTFNVTLEDRYGFLYEKEISDVKEKGSSRGLKDETGNN